MESIMNVDDNMRRVRQNFQTHLANDGFRGPFLHDFASWTSSSHILWKRFALKCPSSLFDSWNRSFVLNPFRYALTITEVIQWTVKYRQQPDPSVSTGKIFPSLQLDKGDYWRLNRSRLFTRKSKNLLWWWFPWQYKI